MSVKPISEKALEPKSYKDYGCTLQLTSEGKSQIYCVERSTPYGIGEVDIPVGAKYLSFDYAFENPGDGDYAAVYLDDFLLWMVKGTSVGTTAWRSTGPLPIEGLSGSRRLTVVLNGVGEKNAIFTAKNFSTSAPNVVPIAHAGTGKTVRLGAKVQLDGSKSFDPDAQPGPLSGSWRQVSGPTAALSGSATPTPYFTPAATGNYVFELIVSDTASVSAPSRTTILVPLLGDIDGDNDVDNDDLAKITSALNKPADGPNDFRDLDGDGKITALDARKLVLLCTRPRCATK